MRRGGPVRQGKRCRGLDACCAVCALRPGLPPAAHSATRHRCLPDACTLARAAAGHRTLPAIKTSSVACIIGAPQGSCKPPVLPSCTRPVLDTRAAANFQVEQARPTPAEGWQHPIEANEAIQRCISSVLRSPDCVSDHEPLLRSSPANFQARGVGFRQARPHSALAPRCGSPEDCPKKLINVQADP